jgi:ABC-2 type transport system ATP-binding protein
MSEPSVNNPLIEVRHIHKSFKTVQAVRDVSFTISQGQFVALLGPNGAGKTTTVEMIEGIQKPDQGEIRIMGLNWKEHADRLRPLIGLSLQETRFVDKLNVVETLRLFASFYSLPASRVEEIITTVGLQEKRKAAVENLSGGQRQRLALGIALLNYPNILLLDEPTTGLDPNARREIWNILLQLKKNGRTSLILTTHYMEEAEKLCDYIIIFHNGEILKEGSRNALLDEGDGRKIVEFELEKNETAESYSALRQKFDQLAALFRVHWDRELSKGSVALTNLETELPLFLEHMKELGLTICNLSFRKKTLDDLFTELTGRHLDD